VDGVSTLMTSLYATMARGAWRDGRGENMLDGGAPFYSVYETCDGKHVAIGSIESRFFKELLARTGIDPESVGPQHDRRTWPELRGRLAQIFSQKTRAEWCRIMEGTDVCFAPVLSPVEAREHPHLRERSTLVEVNGILQPAPAPRFSRTASTIRSAPAVPGAHTLEILAEYGFEAAEIHSLRDAGVLA
jgi:alpha-methylacyl-CoA racemase